MARMARTAPISLGRIKAGEPGQAVVYEPAGAPVRALRDVDELIYELDKALTIGAQLARPDLLFVHAAVVEFGGQAIVLAAPSGTGKSTATFAMLHHGFGYLSDELAPIDPVTLRVHPYPHALCLKALPPAPYLIPQGTLDAQTTLHVPAGSLPARAWRNPLPLSAIAFLHRDAPRPGPCLSALSAASAATRLLSNALNLLAHAEQGTDVAVALARRVPAYMLDIGDLAEAARALREAVAAPR